MPTDYKDKMQLIAGNAHRDLANAIAECGDIPLCNAEIGRFPDGEIDIKINDDVRGTDCFVLQPLCPPVNENWVELLLLLDCLRRASAGRVTDSTVSASRRPSAEKLPSRCWRCP